MKKFLIKIALFFAIFTVVDFLSGYFFGFLRNHAKGGSTEKSEYIANKMNDEIIVLGSSRATHHYNPYILTDSLGLSCYNCGEEGNGAILAYGRYKMFTSRYKPRLIIYEVTPGFDYYVWDPYSKYLGYLRPYYDKPGIKEIFQTFDDDLSFVRMQSRMYQNNSRLIQDIVDNMVYRDNNKGFAPLYGKSIVAAPIENRDFVVDSLKLNCMITLIIDAKKNNIPIVMAISPVYHNAEGACIYKEAVNVSKKYDIPLIDYRDYAPISEDISLFQDPVHLNTKGAEMFSSIIASELKHKQFE